MRLSKLTLNNFKGIKNFVLEAEGKNVNIFGTNATGKTTIYDSLSWLLKDKDSKDKSQFEIKPLEKSGAAVHGIETVVEGIFIVNSSEIQLKKIYKEIWTKPRGALKKIFSGHTNEYEVNGVPEKKKEYIEKISKILDPEIFKLLTDPLYFSEILQWKRRREILLEICGDITDDEVIKSDKKLKGLSKIPDDRSIDDHKKVIASQKKKINEQIEKLPVRIDEVVIGLPDISDIEIEKAEVIAIKKQIKEDQEALVLIESGGEVAEKTKMLREVEGKIISIENELSKGHNEKVELQRDLMGDVNSKAREYKDKFGKINSAIEQINKDISDHESKSEILRKEWHVWHKKEFVPPENPEKCYACGHDIEESVRTELSEKALSSFNLKKSESLEKINKDGSDLKEKIELKKTDLSEKQTELKEIQTKIHDINNKIMIEKGLLEKLESFDLKPDTEIYKAIKTDGVKLVEDIELLQLGSNKGTGKIKELITVLEYALSQSEKKILDFENSKKGKDRIEFLKNEERELAEKLEELESELFLIESFEKKQAEMIESKVNKHFELANFKLFKQQINEGITPCCETLYKGVPYSTGLNNGARINTGLDIIRTLSKHYKTEVPLFIDNSESVVKTIDMDCQVIKLIVSEEDKKLRIEVDK